MSAVPDLPDEGEFVTKPINNKVTSALFFRSMGHSLEEVCEIVGFGSTEEAQRAVNKALKEEYENDPKSRERSRQMVDAILKRLIRSVSVKALDPAHAEHLAAVGKMRELIADHRKLFGLDAPSQVVVHNPSDSEIEKWVLGMAKEHGNDLEEEYDILEGEVVDDEEDGPESLPALRGA